VITYPEQDGGGFSMRLHAKKSEELKNSPVPSSYLKNKHKDRMKNLKKKESWYNQIASYFGLVSAVDQ